MHVSDATVPLFQAAGRQSPSCVLLGVDLSTRITCAQRVASLMHWITTNNHPAYVTAPAPSPDMDIML